MSLFTKTDRRYLSKARQAADISDYKNVHIGCVAVYKGNIVGIGCNTNKTHPVQKYFVRDSCWLCNSCLLRPG